MLIRTPKALQAFIAELDKKFAADKLCCVWEGFELELGPDAATELEQARSWLIEWTKARLLITAEAVYDLSGYAPRVEGIGQAKPVYSLYIVRAGEKGGWLPENVEVGIAFKPAGSDQTILLPFAQKDQAAFERALSDATAAGKTEFRWPGLPTPIGIPEAQGLKADVDLALKEVQAGCGYSLEALCVLLWDKQGFHAHCTPKSGDGGVDVVARREGVGCLIQCKASSHEDHALGWEAVRDVSAGAKAYMSQYPGVQFKQVAVTNQRFNKNANDDQARVLGVELIDREGLLDLLRSHPVQLHEFRLSVA